MRVPGREHRFHCLVPIDQRTYARAEIDIDTRDEQPVSQPWQLQRARE